MNTDWLARKITSMERRIEAMSRGPRLGNASLDNSNIPVYDEDGNVRLRFGRQDDGTHALKYVEGPPPPAPLAPEVSVDGPVVRARFVGLDGEVPEDFHRIEVHLAAPGEDIMSSETMKSSMTTAFQDEAVMVASETGTHRVALVAVSMSNAHSEMSPVTVVDVELVNLKGAIDQAVDNASGGTNYYSPTMPEGTDHTENDLWFDTSVDPETGLTAYTAHRWDPETGQWVSIADERTAALEEAQRDFEATVTEGLGEAQQAAQSAQQAADGALEAAGDAMTEAETARDEATSKAAAAQQAAEAHADAVAEAERLAAIAAASDDATAKANAAKAAAEVTAAADAKAKADAAQAAAEAKAKTAQDAADAAQSKADEAMGRANEAHTRAGNAEDAAADAMQAATHNAKNLWSTADPSGTAPQGTIWFKIDQQTKNVVGQWQQTAGSDTAFGSNWEKRQLTDALFDNIDAGKVNTGYLDVAALIRAGAITADKLLIGSGGNLLSTPNFENNGEGWGSGTDIVPGEGKDGSNLLRIPEGTSTRGSYLGLTESYAPYRHRVTGGEVYRVSAWVRAPEDFVGSRAYIYVRFYTPGDKASGDYRWGSPSSINSLGAGLNAGNVWHLVEGFVTAPEGAVESTIGLYANSAHQGIMEWSLPSVQQAVGSTLIEPGSITTGHILAGAITAESGIIQSIDLGVATVGYLNGARIEAGTIDTPQLAFGAATGDIIAADAIDGKVITGATVRTNPSGSRVELNPEGIEAWNGNLLTFNVDRSTGSVQMLGDLFSGVPGSQRVVIDDDFYTSTTSYEPEDGGAAVPASGAGLIIGLDAVARRRTSLGLANSTSGGTVAAWRGPYLGDRVPKVLLFDSGSAYVRSDPAAGGIGPGLSVRGSGSVSLGTDNDTALHLWPNEEAALRAGGGAVNLRPGGTIDIRTGGGTAGGFAKFHPGTGGGVDMAHVNTGNGYSSRMSMTEDRIDFTANQSLTFDAQGGEMAFSADSTGPFMRSRSVTNRTYSYSANMYITGSGVMGKSTSARKFKTDERVEDPAEYAEALLSIPFKSWVDKTSLGQHEDLQRFRKDHPMCPTPEYLADAPETVGRPIGAVAEDFVDAGLSQFVTFDAYGQVEGLQYDRIGVALIPVVRDLRDRITELENRHG